ncbi:hypothetical protein sos41_11780 [Alphaproteobacteria bacterium SO-S41]|nr:hypothetical protein sos41_11780 [Alphaproteobacteria bacterium SO-S41]
MTLDEMKLALSALRAARFKGLRSASYDGRSVTYGSDAEMASAAADLEKLIAAEESAPVAPRRRIYTTSSKGL